MKRALVSFYVIAGLSVAFSTAQAKEITSFYHDPTGPVYQYDRFRQDCVDVNGISGLNAGYVGECGNLRGANLATFDLTGKNLRGADLQGAILLNANLTEVDLRAAKLLYSNWENTIFTKAVINNETSLPFPWERVRSLGMTVREWNDIDQAFRLRMEDWLTHKSNALPIDITEYIEDGADYLMSGGTYVHYAVKNNYRAVLDYFVNRRGLDINGTYEYFYPYIFSAIRHNASMANTIEMVTYLLQHHADPNALDSEGASALWVAASSGLTDVMNLLLQAGADVDFTYKGKNLITMAVLEQSIEVVDILLKAGAKVNNCFIDGQSCSMLEEALANRRMTIAELLLKNGANAAITHRAGSMLDYVDEMAMMQALIKAGANAKDAQIAKRTDTAVIEFLLQNGANLEKPDDSGNTLLINGVENLNQGVIDFALSKKANVNARNSRGLTALSYVFKNKEITDLYFQKLLDLGADPNVTVISPDPYDRNRFQEVPALRHALVWRQYFLPLARAKADINGPVQSRYGSSTAVIEYILGFSQSLTPQEHIDLDELVKLGADLNRWVDGRDMRRPEITVRQYSPTSNFTISTGTYDKTKISLLGQLFLDSRYILMNRVRQLGADPLREQNSLGQSLAHMAQSAESIKVLSDLGIPLDLIDSRGQNAYYTANTFTWDALVKAGVPFLKADHQGDSALAFIIGDYICEADVAPRIKQAAPYFDLNTLSQKYDLSLAHIIADRAKSESDFSCAKKIFADLKPYKFDLNKKWKYLEGKEGVNPIEGYGLITLLLNSHDEFGDTYETDSYIRYRAALVGFVKYLVTEGYKPLLENPPAGQTPLMHFAYKAQILELVIYLKSLGLPDEIIQTAARTEPIPQKACEFFGTSKSYTPVNGGCASTSGFVWSRAMRLTAAYSWSDHQSYCSQFGMQMPEFSDLMHEYFVTSRPNKYVVYANRKSEATLFNLATGDVQSVDDDQAPTTETYYLCRYRTVTPAQLN